MDVIKTFRKSKLSLSLLTLSLFSLLGTANAANLRDNKFSEMVTFGDSMSDGGFRDVASRYIFNGQLYNEVLSQRYTEKAHIPHTKGGTNYAESGSRTSSSQPGYAGFNVTDRVRDYLNVSNGVADPNALYILWSGANDVSDIVEKDLKGLLVNAYNGKKIDLPMSDDFINATVQIGEITRQLVNAGAKYVIVPNIPRAGLSPFTAAVIPSLVDSLINPMVNLLEFNPWPLLSGGASSTANYTSFLLHLDSALRAEQGTYTSVEEQNKAIINAINTAIFSRFGPDGLALTEPVISRMFNTLYDVENEITLKYNRMVDEELAKIDGNIIRLDVDKLFTEIMAVPGDFGFGNVLVGPCVLGVASWECTEKSAGYVGVDLGLFSDWFHPSAEGHFVIADYMQSVIDAPLHVSLLPSAVERFTKTKNNMIDDHLQDQKYKDDMQTYSVFGGYSGSYAKLRQEADVGTDGKEMFHELSVGFSAKLANEVTLGLMLSGGGGNFKNDDVFKYNIFGLIGSVFAQYTHNSGFWGNVDAHYGKTSLKDIERTLLLGPATRIESGETKGTSMGARIQLGYGTDIYDIFKVGPIVGFDWSKSTINGYAEDDDNSTSMYFGKQEKTTSVGKIGLFVDTHTINFKPFVSITYNHNFDYESERALRASIKSSTNTFERLVETDAKKWLEARIGFNVDVMDNTKLYASVNFIHENTKTNRGNASVGLNYAF